ncbi:MAG: (d)CMP kinase [bacterium]|nr:(d)CMP kinase [bacterium]
MNNHKINIAIDGYSSCGKGTLAKELAKELGYLFIDSGAMYRAVTLALIRNDIAIDDLEAIGALLPKLEISFEYNGVLNHYQTLLNGDNIESEIRTMKVSNLVSPVSKIDAVRTFLVRQQKAIGQNKGVVMDGRDIGTVVFPDAELKIFMTAQPEIRAQRRLTELKQNGDILSTFDNVLENLKSRDLQDSTRLNSPLRQAEDAIVIDNSNLSRAEQKVLALNLAYEKIGQL